MSKAKVFMIVLVTAGLSGIWFFTTNDKTQTTTTDKSDKTHIEKSAPVTSQEMQPMDEESTEEAKKNIWTGKSEDEIFAEARNRMITVSEVLAEMESVKKMFEKTDKARFKQEMALLKKKLNKLKKELTPMLAESKLARDELLDMVKNESNAELKKDLGKLYFGLDEAVQAEYYEELTKTKDLDNQVVGVRFLTKLGTDEALSGLSSAVESPNSFERTKKHAVHGIGQSAVVSENQAFQVKAYDTLRDYAATNPDPKVRKNAFHALTMRRDFTQADKDLIAQAMANDSDQYVRKAAEFAQRIVEARERSKAAKAGAPQN